MISKEVVEKIINDRISASEVFVVSISVQSGGLIQVFLDQPGGISIRTCAEFSRLIESNLDRENEDFELRVSSPGLDKAFKVPQQYIINIGNCINVVDLDGEKYKGILKASDETGIEMEAEVRVESPGRKKKVIETKSVRLEYIDIKTAKVNLEF